MIRYFTALNSIESVFPFETNQFAAHFRWKDAFTNDITSKLT